MVTGVIVAVAVAVAVAVRVGVGVAQKAVGAEIAGETGAGERVAGERRRNGGHSDAGRSGAIVVSAGVRFGRNEVGIHLQPVDRTEKPQKKIGHRFSFNVVFFMLKKRFVKYPLNLLGEIVR